MKSALYRRLAKLEAVSKPPTRILFETMCERPGIKCKRLISREEHGNVVFETWEGPLEDPLQNTTQAQDAGDLLPLEGE
jgi:hypothetical protein